jgi:hypothetical protein
MHFTIVSMTWRLLLMVIAGGAIIKVFDILLFGSMPPSIGFPLLLVLAFAFCWSASLVFRYYHVTIEAPRSIVDMADGLRHQNCLNAVIFVNDRWGHFEYLSPAEYRLTVRSHDVADLEDRYIITRDEIRDELTHVVSANTVLAILSGVEAASARKTVST